MFILEGDADERESVCEMKICLLHHTASRVNNNSQLCNSGNTIEALKQLAETERERDKSRAPFSTYLIITDKQESELGSD